MQPKDRVLENLEKKGLAEHAQKEEKKWERKYKKRSEIRSWFSLAIAILAFVLSIISLAWQVRTAQLEETHYECCQCDPSS